MEPEHSKELPTYVQPEGKEKKKVQSDVYDTKINIYVCKNKSRKADRIRSGYSLEQTVSTTGAKAFEAWRCQYNCKKY